jgi:hypothetical protein
MLNQILVSKACSRKSVTCEERPHVAINCGRVEPPTAAGPSGLNLAVGTLGAISSRGRPSLADPEIVGT